MKRLLVVTAFVVLPAFADDFSTRVAEAKRVASSIEGAHFEKSLGPHIGAVMRTCIPRGSTDPANVGSFSLVARVSTTGALTEVEVEPRTKVSLCFAKEFGQVRLPSPPQYVSPAGYPLLVEMQVTP